MPELPDITVYIEALKQRVLDQTLNRVVIASPFLLRSIEPPAIAAQGHQVRAVRRIGKRIAIGLDNDVWLVLHLMIAGRLHWVTKKVKPDGRRTQAGSQKRASLHVVAGERELAALDPGGIDVFSATPAEFADRLTFTNHTLKRSLTDPRLFSGIGNAYSDEILHRAELSPILLTQKMSVEQVERLRLATLATLIDWTERLRAEAGAKFPENVTAFREEMAVHGRYGLPCPRCGTKVQRIRYASNETNYCPVCQTGGKLLADRALSRLLGKDWPRTLEELEEMRK
jgi:formamidopyrimidine-DNA glycosylase